MAGVGEGNKGEIVIYQAAEGGVAVDVRMVGETVWLNLNQMAALFERDKSVISRHLRNVFTSGELAEEATVAKFATVQTEGSREVAREIEFFTAAPEQRNALETLSKQLDLPLWRIGQVLESGRGEVRLLDAKGQPQALKHRGFDHFDQ